VLTLEQLLAWVKILSDTYGVTVFITAIVTIAVFGAFLNQFVRRS